MKDSAREFFNNIEMKLKQLKICSLLLLLGAFAASLTSCNLINEEEGDCRSRYRVRFVYDKNLKWANAFPSEVHAVNLYIFDENGIFVKEFAEAGEQLAQPGFCISFDDETVAPGKYTLLAWCLNPPTKAEGAFEIPSPVAGETRLEEMTCVLSTLSDSQYPQYSDEQLPFLYHGMAEVELPDAHRGLTYDYTVSLTKDTNHIRIILQELSGDDIDASQFEMRIESANGRLAYNNLLLPDNPTVAYLPWALTADRMALNENGTITYNYGLIGDLSTSRMMASHEGEFFLTIVRKDTGDEVIANVPVIQYALLSKEYYEDAYGHSMTNQDFLDREDEYVLTFFLYDGRWLDSSILINSWRVVLHDYELS